MDYKLPGEGVNKLINNGLFVFLQQFENHRNIRMPEEHIASEVDSTHPGEGVRGVPT